MGKNTKNTKIQSAFWDPLEKYKNNTKIQGVFFGVYCVFSCICATKKKYKKYESKISKIQNTKKYKPKISKMQNTKKKTQNLQNTKYKKYKFNIRKKGPTLCSFWKETTKLQKKCKTTMLYFLHHAILILYF